MGGWVDGWMDGWIDRQTDREIEAGSLGHTSVVSPFPIPYSTWVCGQDSAWEPEHFRGLYAAQSDPGRMDRGEGGCRLGLGSPAGETVAQADGRRRAVTRKLGAWGLRLFHGSAPK